MALLDVVRDHTCAGLWRRSETPSAHLHVEGEMAGFPQQVVRHFTVVAHSQQRVAKRISSVGSRSESESENRGESPQTTWTWETALRATPEGSPGRVHPQKAGVRASLAGY
jgi:hypothetical protein